MNPWQRQVQAGSAVPGSLGSDTDAGSEKIYVTGMLAGRAYQSYVPRPLLPFVEREHVDLFRRLDRRFLQSLDPDRFSALVVEIVAQARNKADPSKLLQDVQKTVTAHLDRDQIGVHQLKKINACLQGDTFATKPSFRESFVWISAPHPALSWHVGSPPDMLQPLVKNLLNAKAAAMPASLWMVLAMFRLLQIHPFLDGNGRTARFYALWILRKFIGPSLEGARMIHGFWDRKAIDLGSMSLLTQSSGRFDDVFDHIRRCQGNI